MPMTLRSAWNALQKRRIDPAARKRSGNAFGGVNESEEIGLWNQRSQAFGDTFTATAGDEPMMDDGDTRHSPSMRRLN